MSRGHWSNMPKTIDLRYLEQTLITQGACVFFKDDVLGYLCLPVVLNGKLDVYGNPYDFMAISDTGYNKKLDVNSGVIIYNNYLHNQNESKSIILFPYLTRMFCKSLPNTLTSKIG